MKFHPAAIWGRHNKCRALHDPRGQIRDFGFAAIFAAVTSSTLHLAAKACIGRLTKPPGRAKSAQRNCETAMHKITRALPTIAAMVAVFFVGTAHAQQARQMTLPQGTVTEPLFVPLYLRDTPDDFFNTTAYQRNPYFGISRVEEDKFTPVPCSNDIARVAPVSTASCLQGYHLVPGYRYHRGRNARCNIDHDVTIYDVGDLSVEADVLVFDPYLLAGDGTPGVNCFVWGYSGYDQEDFQDMNRITRRGTNWHDLQGLTCDWKDRRAECQAKSIQFSYGLQQCVAIRRPGPYWEGGYVWMLTASICHTDMASLQSDDVARALASLQIRTYDPVGNIRPPPQQR
jgi:hypothetical protein